MTKRRSAVLVSNRGPVSFTRTGTTLEPKRGAGGLAGALDPVARNLGDEAVWIAAAISDEDRDALAEGVIDDMKDLLGYPVRMLPIDTDVYARYYDDVSNRMLWFAQHCLWDEVGIRAFGDDEIDAYMHAYKPVNSLFADAAAEEVDQNGIVLFQDYHLALAPEMLRSQRPDTTILHFTHSSFCGPEGLDRLPRPIPAEVVRGMLGANLVGFHIPRWVNGFLECCDRAGFEVDERAGTVRFGGHVSWVRPYPIPIEAGDLRARVRSAKVRSWADRFRPKDGARLIVRADRCELSKNIVRGFLAFGELLDRREDLRESVRFVACLYPSRRSMREYREYTESVEAAAKSVTSRYPGSIDLFMADNFDRTLGALTVYDVLLVNPIMDGMNLVSKEGPAINERDGALVLSTGAGSFDELGAHTIPILDPLDVDETSRKLEKALDLDPELRVERAASLRRIVESSTPERWIEAQLNDLEEIRSKREPLTAPSNPGLS